MSRGSKGNVRDWLTHAQKADVLVAEKQYDSAIDSYHAALAALDLVAISDSGSAQVWINVGVTLGDLSDVLILKRMYSSAEINLRKALDAFEKAIAIDPMNTAAARGQADAYRRCGLLELRDGRLAQAAHSYNLARDRYDQIVLRSDVPDHIEIGRAEVQEAIGRIRQGSYETYVVAALSALRDQIARAAPQPPRIWDAGSIEASTSCARSVTNDQNELISEAASYYLPEPALIAEKLQRVGSVAIDSSRVGESIQAEILFGYALRLLKAYTDEFGWDMFACVEACRIWMEIGRFAEDSDTPFIEEVDRAANAYDSAHIAAISLLSFRRSVIDCSGELALGVEAWARSRLMRSQLADKNNLQDDQQRLEEVEDLKASLAGSDSSGALQIGRIWREWGEGLVPDHPDDAMELLDLSTEVLDLCLNVLDDPAKALSELVLTYRSIADLYLELGDVESAMEEYSNEAQRYEHWLEEAPGNYDVLIGLGVASRKWGELELDRGSHQHAKIALEQSVDAYALAAEQFPDDQTLLRDLGVVTMLLRRVIRN